MADRVRVGEGRQAEILDAGPGRVLRLLWDADHEPWLIHEETALRAAREAGAPVPAVYERMTVDGRPGLVMERLDGPDLLARVGRRPWAVTSTGRMLGKLQARLHAVRAPAELPDVKRTVGDLLTRGADHVPSHLAEEARAALVELPDGDRLCHGDFHPGNVILASTGPSVIDWPAASRGNPIADVARTLLIVQLGELPEQSPLLVRRLDAIGRKLMVRSYLAAYGRPDPDLVTRWQRVLTIARLGEGIDAERARLLAVLERA